MLLAWLLSIAVHAQTVDGSAPGAPARDGLEIAAKGERTSFDVEIYVRFDGNLYLDDEIILDTDIPLSLERMMEANPELRVVVASDQDAPHGRVVEVLQIVDDVGVERVALEVGGVEHESADDPLFPGDADTVEAAPVTELDSGLTKDQLRQLKPKRHRFPQNPYGSTDFTAYTVEWGETKIGLFNVQHGIIPRTQIGTVPLLDAVGVYNANLKANLMREGIVDGALLANVYVVPVNQLIRRYSDQYGLGLFGNNKGQQLFTSNITYLGLGAMTSVQVAKPWSVHAGLTYARIGARGQFDFDNLPTILIPGSKQALGGDIQLVPRLVGELVQMRFASDLRFNRRDSLVFQFQAPIYAQARGAFSGDVGGFPKELKNLDFIIAYGDWVPVADAYRWSVSWQFSWKHVDLRAGVGTSPIVGSWTLQAFDLSYRFGGETRREERDIRRGFRQNKRDLRKGADEGSEE